MLNLVDQVTTTSVSKYFSAMTYWVIFSTPIQLLYSQFSPFIYLIILKKFQEYHVKVYLSVWRFLFSKEVALSGKQNNNCRTSKKIRNYRQKVDNITKCFSVYAVLLIALLCCVSVSMSGFLSSSVTGNIHAKLQGDPTMFKAWKNAQTLFSLSS